MQSFIFLQLSDLHFGDHSRFHGMDLGRLAENCADAIDRARQDLAWQEQVGLVVVTGDVAEAARPAEYCLALEFFAALVNELALVRTRVVFVPGNHDVSWSACEAVRLQVRDRTLKAADEEGRLSEVKLARFDAMVEAFYDGSAYREPATGGSQRPDSGGWITPLARGAYVHDFQELGVSVAALNSCEQETEQKHGGLISKEQAQALLDHWSKAPPRLRLMAVHHNPVASPPAQVREWGEWLQKQFDADTFRRNFAVFVSDVAGFEGRDWLQRVADQAQVSLLLHGHHHVSDLRAGWNWMHAPAGGSTHVVSAGSWGLVAKKLPAEQPAVMQLARVDLETKQVRAVLLRYEPRAVAPGNVEPGHFVLDEVTRRQAPLVLSLPSALPGIEHQRDGARQDLETKTRDSAEQMIAAYRKRMRYSAMLWELPGAVAMRVGSDRDFTPTLDHMYVPLPVAGVAGERPAIGPEELVARDAPVMVIGSAGSGKTTWMKWTFRRLLEMDEVLPFFLELRAVARIWNRHNSIEGIIREQLKSSNLSDDYLFNLPVQRMSSSIHNIVLLMDGWDELGSLGSPVRAELQSFRTKHPHVQVVVTSRPFESARPDRVQRSGGGRDFDIYQIQPLSDRLVVLLAERFYRHVRRQNPVLLARGLLNRLRAAPAARALAGTAFHLAMLLWLDGKGPLPEKRHLLYLTAVRSLLFDLPKERGDGDSDRWPIEWRPEERSRLKVVAELAYRLQCQPQKGGIAARVASGDIERLMPSDWEAMQREGFIRWLINMAGVLVDFGDDSISFAHLSFQEFLSAWHLCYGEFSDERQREQALERHASSHHWLETLLLWAGLHESRDAIQFRTIMASMSQKANMYWLVGAVFADGMGADADFFEWCDAMSAEHIRAARFVATDCARAWRDSRQSKRKEFWFKRVDELVLRAHWFDALTFESFRAADVEWKRPAVLRNIDAAKDSELALALSRAWAGASWLIPGHAAITLLRLWPAQRCRIALSLQTLASLNASRDLVKQVLRSRIQLSEKSKKEQWLNDRVVLAVVRHVVRDLGFSPGVDLVRDLVRDFGRDVGLAFCLALGRVFFRCASRRSRDAMHVLKCVTSSNFGSDMGRMMVRDAVRDFERAVARNLNSRSIRHSTVNAVAELWSLDPESAHSLVWRDYLPLELASVAGRSSLRAALTTEAPSSEEEALEEVALVRLACGASLDSTPDSETEHLEQALAQYQGDPLWPALARHIAHRSTLQDRELLEGLARAPSQRRGVLSWGLKYYVRGDLVLQDNTVVTLDDLCEELGLPTLPLLEDMPDGLPNEWVTAVDAT